MMLVLKKRLYYKPCTITSKTKQTINNEKRNQKKEEMQTKHFFFKSQKRKEKTHKQ
jgi:hypothetical protein